MQILSFKPERMRSIEEFDSIDVSSVALGEGDGEAHVYAMRFEPGGAIGPHRTGFGQLFMIVDGSGWVAGEEGRRVELRSGQAAFFPKGVMHAKGSDSGMSVVMVQVSDLRPSEE